MRSRGEQPHLKSRRHDEFFPRFLRRQSGRAGRRELAGDLFSGRVVLVDGKIIDFGGRLSVRGREEAQQAEETASDPAKIHRIGLLSWNREGGSNGLWFAKSRITLSSTAAEGLLSGFREGQAIILRDGLHWR